MLGGLADAALSLPHGHARPQALADFLYSVFSNSVIQACYAAIPLHRLRRAEGSAPWWHFNPALGRLRDVYYKAARQRKDHPFEYKQAQQAWRSGVKLAKNRLWDKQMAGLTSDHKKAPRQFWKTFRVGREEVGDPTEDTKVGAVTHPDPPHQPPSSPQEAVDFLSMFFERAFTEQPAGDRLTEDMISRWILEDCTTSSACDGGRSHSSCEALITGEDLGDLITNIKEDTAPGPDSIPAGVLHCLPGTARAWLANILSYCFKHGVVPWQFQRSRVVPLYKGSGPRTEGGNYRPISITSVVARLYEHAVKGVIERQIKKDALSSSQFGFRKAHRTHQQVLLLLERIRLTHKLNAWLPAFVIDVKRAFDCVPHNHLLFLLSEAGIHGSALRAVRALLTDRWFMVQDGGYRSSWRPAVAGVPQGCVLSPLLFLIYINGAILAMAGASSDITVLAYADDILVVPSCCLLDGTLMSRKLAGGTWSSLTRAMAALADWGSKWRMVFSESKSRFVVFTRNKRRPCFPNILVNGAWPSVPCGTIYITQAAEYRYLGFPLVPSLSWDKLGKEIVSQLKARSMLLRRIVHGRLHIIPFSTIRLLSLNFVQAVLTYYLPLATFSEKLYTTFDSLTVRACSTALGLPARGVRFSRLRAELGIMPAKVFAQYLSVGLCRSFFMLPSWLDAPHSTSLLQDFRQFKALREAARHAGRSTPQHDSFLGGVLGSLAAIDCHPDKPGDLVDLNCSAIRHKLMTKWADEHRIPLTKFELLQHPDRYVPLYLQLESATLAGHRMRLRLHVSALNADLHYNSRSDTEICPHCNDSSQDHAHMIMFCPHPGVVAARRTMQTDLLQFNTTASVQLVLGYMLNIPLPHQHEVMSISGQFLVAVARAHYAF